MSYTRQEIIAAYIAQRIGVQIYVEASDVLKYTPEYKSRAVKFLKQDAALVEKIIDDTYNRVYGDEEEQIQHQKLVNIAFRVARILTSPEPDRWALLEDAIKQVEEYDLTKIESNDNIHSNG